MIVTINTDASFSKEHRIGSFAFWIVCNKFKILKSGVLRRKVTRPEIAEFKCIINALHVLFNEDCSCVTKIIINTDCLNVIHLINKDKTSINRYGLKNWGASLVVHMESVRRKSRHIFSIPIEMRHVRSHTGIRDARSYVNEWCDIEAKKRLNEKLNNPKAK